MSILGNSTQGVTFNDFRNDSHIEQVESLSIGPEVYEKLFLNPKTPSHHSLRQTFAIPTPMCIFVIEYREAGNRRLLAHSSFLE
jgi:hypothetical protein